MLRLVVCHDLSTPGALSKNFSACPHEPSNCETPPVHVGLHQDGLTTPPGCPPGSLQLNHFLLQITPAPALSQRAPPALKLHETSPMYKKAKSALPLPEPALCS
mmetsp:Transcript_97106/g.175468  ORF Transcript_97106/g.175468 Transcript_97106/m.175468 type:complete len:104 (+) Transcript_97106:280-591(+)